jgi:WD40 repeat protein
MSQHPSITALSTLSASLSDLLSTNSALVSRNEQLEREREKVRSFLKKKGLLDEWEKMNTDQPVGGSAQNHNTVLLNMSTGEVGHDDDDDSHGVVGTSTASSSRKLVAKLPKSLTSLRPSAPSSSLSANWTPIRQYSGHGDAVTSIATPQWAPALLLTASLDGSARVWHPSVAVGAWKAVGHRGPVLSVAAHPSARIMLTGSGDGTARVWGIPRLCEGWKRSRASDDEDGEGGTRRRRLGSGGGGGGDEDDDDVPTARTSSANVLWSPLMESNGSAHKNDLANVDVQSDSSLDEVPTAGKRVGDTPMHGARSIVVPKRPTIRKFRLELLASPAVTAAAHPPCVAASFAAGGRSIVTAAGCSWRLFDSVTGRTLSAYTVRGDLTSVAAEADAGVGVGGGRSSGTSLVELDASSGVTFGSSSQATLTSLDTHRASATAVVVLATVGGGAMLADTRGAPSSLSSTESVVQAHDGPCNAVRFLGTSDYSFATSGDDRTIKVWDARSLKAPRSVLRPPASVNSFAVSPSGQYIAAPCDDRRLRIYDVATGQKLCRMPGDRSILRHACAVGSAAWSPDSSVVYSGAWDGSAIAWAAAPPS